tara:strand:- start:315 stop:509 length:195 start_codon:yes stop_codon:yes gene_type:complete
VIAWALRSVPFCFFLPIQGTKQYAEKQQVKMNLSDLAEKMFYLVFNAISLSKFCDKWRKLSLCS